MKIHEYQAKDILARYGVPIQPGRVAHTPDEAAAIARELGGPVVVKAQVYVGGRGKQAVSSLVILPIRRVPPQQKCWVWTSKD